MPLPRIPVAALLLVCAAPLPGRSASAVQETGPADGQDLRTRVQQILARPPRDPRGETEAVHRLAGLGAPALPVLLEGLALGSVSAADGVRRRLDGASAALVRAAVARIGRGPLISAAQAALAAHADFPVPECLPPWIEGIAVCGSAADLALALDLAMASETDDLAGLAAQRCLTNAMREVAAREEGALRELRRWVNRAGATMDLALVRGAAACGQPGALRALVDVLAEDESLFPTVVSELPRAARWVPRPLDESLLARLREAIEDPEAPQERTLAALRAAGALGDAGALPHAIERLRSEDPRMRHAAHAALRAATGLLHDDRAQTWQAWLTRERAWFEDELTHLRSDLSSSQVGEVVAALRELAAHRYRRDELAWIAAASLEHSAEAVRLEAIAALSALGSPAPLRALRERLGAHEEPEESALRECIARLGGPTVARSETGAP
jgi:hypothetical protein